MQNKTTRICHHNKIKINMNGDVFPCCRAPEGTYIGNIFDEDIIEKIANINIICECQMYKSVPTDDNGKFHLNFIHYETSNLCQANCVCCPQNKVPNKNEEEHLNKIRQLIEYYKPNHIAAIGGEILVQNKAFEMLYELKTKYPDMKIHTISNLSVGMDRLKEAENIFDEITVSILGFSPLTYKNEMDLEFDVVMRNIEYLIKNQKVKIRPKYLTMPTNLFEIIPFFKWALALDVEKIYLHNIHEFQQVADITTPYWKKTFTKLEKQLKNIFEDNIALIKSKNRHFISIHQILADLTNINNDYLKTIGLDKFVFITR